MHYASKTTVVKCEVIGSNADDIYEDYWEDDLKSGTGSLKRKDGSTWTGTWRNDELSTNEQILMSNGDLYEGELIDKVPNGQGTMTYAATGAKYQGEWLKGKRQGSGTLEYPSGMCYRGQWRYDRQEG
jgi:hypothetical protein